AYVELSLSLPLGVQVEGRDLLTELYLTSSQARQGLRTEVLGTLVQVPPGSRDGQPLRVPHAGLHGGDLQLTLRVDELRGTMRSVGSWIGQAAGTLTQNLSEAWRERRRRRGP